MLHSWESIRSRQAVNNVVSVFILLSFVELDFMRIIHFLLHGVVLAAFYYNEDRLCDPNGADADGYTGFRLYRRYSYGWPVLHHWHVVHCRKGKVDLSQYFPASRNSDFYWNSMVCLTSELCYKFSRRKRYVQRKIPLYAANVMVGGLFKCESKHSCNHSIPLLPLVSSSTREGFQYRRGGRLLKYVPILFTPDFTHDKYPHAIELNGIPEWAKLVDVNENYIFTTKDYQTPWYLINKAINKVYDLTSFQDSVVPWEFDPVEHEYSRTRLRDRIQAKIGERMGLGS